MNLLWHKLLPTLLLPVGLVAVCIGWGLLRRRAVWVAAGLALLVGTSLPVVGDLLLRIPENLYPHLEAEAAPPADAIVVLSGMLRGTPPEWRRPECADAFDRFEAGLALLRAERAPTLVFTPGQTPWGRTRQPEGEVLARIARERGVPPERILCGPGVVGNTAEEAAAVAALGRERGWRRILLVTSAFHQPRAVHLFAKTGLQVVPFPCDYRTARGRPAAAVDFLPCAEGMQKTELAMREFLGYIFYRLRG